MQSLADLVDNSRTDKNTQHSYLDLYQKLLFNKKETAKNILEIGIWQGGSIKLWSDFFTNATVYGLDIFNIDDMCKEFKKEIYNLDDFTAENIYEDLKNKKNIVLYTSINAYDDIFFKNNLLNKNIKFDFMLDDGPHSLESMKKFINLYSQIMTDDGILIIEDIPTWDWIEILKNEVADDSKNFIKVYDLRHIKNQYDDIVFTIDKSKTDIQPIMS
jgi:hypothetical protein